jgi:hypothetical protein
MQNHFPKSQVVGKLIRLSIVFITILTLSYASIAQADVSGIPSNSDFPNAQYPYAQALDACSGVTDRPDSNGEIRDTWGPVDFRGACDTHDMCYYTVGSNWNTCNERLYSDLRAACERDLKISFNVPDPSLSNPLGTRRVDGPPDPVRLTACYTIASGYYVGVQGGVALGVFDKAQKKQKNYESWVASIRNPSPASPASPVSPTSPTSNPVFDAEFYLRSYRDLRDAFGTNQESAKEHWLNYGIKEGRRSSPAFDVQYYLSVFPDLQNAFGASNHSAAINHWLTYGIDEGRRSSIVFDVKYYLDKYPDLQNAFGSSNYSAAVNHWLTYGVSEGRQGSPDFDSKFYLSNNPDVAEAYGVNNYKGAIEHYLEYGKGEGRKGTS